MSAVEQITEPLVAGERLSRDEFLRRWDSLPDLKNAELIEGVVYLSSPVSIEHWTNDTLAIVWVGYYGGFTPGCKAGSNGTWLMLKDAPQPDAHLCVLPEYGGQSGVQARGRRHFASGAPELAIEVSLSSASHDLGPKLRLYRAAGVREYINVLVDGPKVTWRKLSMQGETFIEPDADDIMRSTIFPGLWLDPDALLRDDTVALLKVLDRGLASPEHARFVAELASRRTNR